jgi:hypothetical protein
MQFKQRELRIFKLFATQEFVCCSQMNGNYPIALPTYLSLQQQQQQLEALTENGNVRERDDATVVLENTLK